MRFAVICLRRDDICTVVASGDYSELSDILDILKNESLESDLSLFEIVATKALAKSTILRELR